MSHDVLAELEGYRNELDRLTKRGGVPERCEAVQAQIDRVAAVVAARASAAAERAESFKASGQDVKAAEQELEARRYRDALTAPGGELETTVADEPRDSATDSGASTGRKTTRGGKGA